MSRPVARRRAASAARGAERDERSPARASETVEETPIAATAREASPPRETSSRPAEPVARTAQTSTPPRPDRRAPPDPAAAGAVVLSTRSLVKAYRGRTVVNEVSIRVAQGEIVGLLGPNGAGKTTTFYMVVGLTPPDRGEVVLGDLDITALPMYLRAQRGISYLPQEASIFRKMSVESNLRAIFETLDLPRSEQARRTELLLREFGLVHVRKSHGYALSGGERRRVEIARALALDPLFILLDEPFAGIDPIAVLDIQAIVRHLKEMGIGVLITDHNVRETLKITDRAYIINNGEILRAGSPAELSADPQVRKIYLGEQFSL
jgi:lipopolysaccharide export system ATP-binding protein